MSPSHPTNIHHDSKVCRKGRTIVVQDAMIEEKMNSAAHKKKKLAALKLQREILNLKKQISSKRITIHAKQSVVRSNAEVAPTKNEHGQAPKSAKSAKQADVEPYKKELSDVKNELKIYHERSTGELEQVREKLKQEESKHKKQLSDVKYELLSVRDEMKQNQEISQSGATKVRELLVQVRAEVLEQIAQLQIEVQLQCQANLEEQMHQELASAKAELRQQYETHSTVLQETTRHELETSRAELQQKYGTLSTMLQERMRQELDTFRAELRKEYETLSSRLQESIRHELNTSRAELQQQYQTLSSDLHEKHRSEVEDLNTQLAEAQRQIDEVVENQRAASVKQETNQAHQERHLVTSFKTQETEACRALDSLSEERLLPNTVPQVEASEMCADSKDEIAPPGGETSRNHHKEEWSDETGSRIKLQEDQSPGRDTPKTTISEGVSTAETSCKTYYDVVQPDEHLEADTTIQTQVRREEQKEEVGISQEVGPVDNDFSVETVRAQARESAAGRLTTPECCVGKRYDAYEKEVSVVSLKAERVEKETLVDEEDSEIERERADCMDPASGNENGDETESLGIDDDADELAQRMNALRPLGIGFDGSEATEEPCLNELSKESVTEYEVELIDEELVCYDKHQTPSCAEGYGGCKSTDYKVEPGAAPSKDLAKDYCEQEETKGDNSIDESKVSYERVLTATFPERDRPTEEDFGQEEGSTSTLSDVENKIEGKPTIAASVKGATIHSWPEEEATSEDSDEESNVEADSDEFSCETSEDTRIEDDEKSDSLIAAESLKIDETDKVALQNDALKPLGLGVDESKAKEESSSNESAGTEGDVELTGEALEGNSMNQAPHYAGVYAEDKSADVLEPGAATSEDATKASCGDEESKDDLSINDSKGSDERKIALAISLKSPTKEEIFCHEQSVTGEYSDEKDGKPHIVLSTRTELSWQQDEATSEYSDQDSDGEDDGEASSCKASVESSTNDDGKSNSLVPAESLKIDDDKELALRRNALKLLGIGVDGSEAKEKLSSDESSDEEGTDEEVELTDEELVFHDNLQTSHRVDGYADDKSTDVLESVVAPLEDDTKDSGEDEGTEDEDSMGEDTYSDERVQLTAISMKDRNTGADSRQEERSTGEYADRGEDMPSIAISTNGASENSCLEDDAVCKESDEDSDSEEEGSVSASSDDGETSSCETSVESSNNDDGKSNSLVPAESSKIDDAGESTLRKNALKPLEIGTEDSEAKEESFSNESSDDEGTDEEVEVTDEELVCCDILQTSRLAADYADDKSTDVLELAVTEDVKKESCDDKETEDENCMVEGKCSEETVSLKATSMKDRIAGVDSRQEESSTYDYSDKDKDTPSIAVSANGASENSGIEDDAANEESDEESDSVEEVSVSESSDDSETSSCETSDESSSNDDGKSDGLVLAESLKIDDADELALRKNALKLLGIGVDDSEAEEDSSSSKSEQESDQADDLTNEEVESDNKKPRGVLRASSFEDDNFEWPPARQGGKRNTISFSDNVTTKEIPKLDVEDKMKLFFDRDDLKRMKDDHQRHLEKKAAKRLFKLGSRTAIDSLPSFWG